MTCASTSGRVDLGPTLIGVRSRLAGASEQALPVDRMVMILLSVLASLLAISFLTEEEARGLV